ncbi:MAG: HAD family hydrolase [Ruthenibacterium sp.]
MAYYHCLLFDLDGTLLDFGAAEDAAIHETLAYYGFVQPQEAVDAYKQINSALWAALERGEVRQEKLVVQRFEKLLADFGVQGDAVAMNDHYLTRLSERADVYPGAQEVLQELAEVATLAVVTNGVDRVQAGRLQRSGLAPYFDGVFVSSRVGASAARKISTGRFPLGWKPRKSADDWRFPQGGYCSAQMRACRLLVRLCGPRPAGRSEGHPCDSKPGRAVPHRYGAGGAGACWK